MTSDPRTPVEKKHAEDPVSLTPEKETAVPRTKNELMKNWLQQLKSPPNMITSARLLSIPYLSYLVVSEQYEWVFAGCFLAGASDFLDGYIARNYNMTTVLGSYLDPVADKALINVLAISLCYVNILPAPFVGIVVLRDVALIGGTYMHVRANTKAGQWVMDPVTTPLQVSATTISKVNTGLQFLTLSIAVIQPVFGTDPQVLQCACWLTGGTTIASALSYVGHSAFSKTGNDNS